jgi:hypothetical protein
VIVPLPIDTRRIRIPNGQKAPLQPKEVWAIRTRLQMAGRVRDLVFDRLVELPRIALSEDYCNAHPGCA